MARVQYGGGVISFKGSIAGNTFQRTRAGDIVRARIARAASTTSLQSDTHAATYDLLTIWRNMSGLDQADWEDFATAHPRVNQFGQTKTLTGFNYFVSINSNRLLAGEAIIYQPPAYTLPTAITTWELATDHAELRAYFAPSPVPADHILAIYTTPPMPGQTLAIKSLARKTVILDVGEESLIDIASDWSTTHGLPLPIGAVYWWYLGSYAYFIRKSTGLVSPAILYCQYSD